MPGRFSMLREAALALFLVAVALGLWLADVRPVAVLGVMALALAVAWMIEWLSWREDHFPGARPVQEEVGADPIAHKPGAAEPASAPVPRARGLWLIRSKRADRASEDVAAGHAQPVSATTPDPEPKPEPETEEAPSALPAADAPAPKAPEAAERPREEPPRPRRRLRPVRSTAPPPPPPEPEPSLPPPTSDPQDAPVVPLWAHSSEPREWNLWDLERIARAQSRRDPERFEEWSYLFLHLRRYANADGVLPAEFDELVRDYFGGLLEPAHGA